MCVHTPHHTTPRTYSLTLTKHACLWDFVTVGCATSDSYQSKSSSSPPPPPPPPQAQFTLCMPMHRFLKLKCHRAMAKPALCGMSSDAEILVNVTFLSKHTPGTILSHYRKKPLLVVTYKYIEFQHYLILPS